MDIKMIKHIMHVERIAQKKSCNDIAKEQNTDKQAIERFFRGNGTFATGIKIMNSLGFEFIKKGLK